MATDQNPEDPITDISSMATHPVLDELAEAYEQKSEGGLWSKVATSSGQVYNWPKSTYIAEPPFFADFTMEPKESGVGVTGARILGIFGDSVTTDHISPAGSNFTCVSDIRSHK